MCQPILFQNYIDWYWSTWFFGIIGLFDKLYKPNNSDYQNEYEKKKEKVSTGSLLLSLLHRILSL